jgi:SAM-dependent methyltransferase
VVVSYDPTIYQGAAAHYRYGRPAYSPQLEAVLTEELDLNGSGRLLDAGCGPGILTVRIAHLFEEAVGLDPDPAMLAEGRRAAHEQGITNIRWVQALAEDLPGAAPGPYRAEISAAGGVGQRPAQGAAAPLPAGCRSRWSGRAGRPSDAALFCGVVAGGMTDGMTTPRAPGRRRLLHRNHLSQLAMAHGVPDA